MPQKKNYSKRPTSPKNQKPIKDGASSKYQNTNLKNEYDFAKAKPLYIWTNIEPNTKSAWRLPTVYKDEIVFLFLSHIILLFGSLILFSLYYNHQIDALQKQIDSLRSVDEFLRENVPAPADNSGANCVLHFCHAGDGRIGA